MNKVDLRKIINYLPINSNFQIKRYPSYIQDTAINPLAFYMAICVILKLSR